MVKKKKEIVEEDLGEVEIPVESDVEVTSSVEEPKADLSNGCIGKKIGGKEIVSCNCITNSEGVVVTYKVTDIDGVTFTLTLEDAEKYVK